MYAPLFRDQAGHLRMQTPFSLLNASSERERRPISRSGTTRRQQCKQEPRYPDRRGSRSTSERQTRNRESTGRSHLDLHTAQHDTQHGGCHVPPWPQGFRPKHHTEAGRNTSQILEQVRGQNKAIYLATATQPSNREAASNSEEGSAGLTGWIDHSTTADQAAREAETPQETPTRTHSTKKMQDPKCLPAPHGEQQPKASHSVPDHSCGRPEKRQRGENGGPTQRE
ncbi:Hypothetical predicted protein [Pelobates cultripes]|uniref:Uncharacterized protein n=1 Tax=Pelobates cultripes TaxID=61616 RepID=A0AAD1SBR0_PELCU|nr:Hypothetical predicted protein [Pelobates cultripes]